MMKNDILRVRIEAQTLAALNETCKASGCNISHLVREILSRDLAQRGKGMIVSDRSASSRLSHDDRRLCAQSLSSLLVGSYSNTRDGAKTLQQRRRKVLRLLESLFRELSRISSLTCRDEKATASSEGFHIANPEQIKQLSVGDGTLATSSGNLNPRQPDAGRSDAESTDRRRQFVSHFDAP